MMDRLPEIIDPLVFAERRTELSGKFELRALARLAEMLVDDAGSVEIYLSFSKQGRDAFIEGWAKATLLMQCQNCLETVEVPLNAVIKLGMLASLEQAGRLPEGYEPLLLQEEKMSLKEIVEDEILLALPAFPKHAFQCVDLTHQSVGEIAAAETVAEVNPNNPFAVLAKFN